MSKFKAKLPHFRNLVPNHHDADNDDDQAFSSSSASPPSSSKPSRPPTEPCSICHFIVGTKTPEDIVEAWAILPCGHRFGSYCVKVWLGMSIDAVCPICRRKMVHACGHPTLPRPSAPPPKDEPDPQPEDEEAGDGCKECEDDCVFETDEDIESAGAGRHCRTHKQVSAKKAGKAVVGHVVSLEDIQSPAPAEGAPAAAANGASVDATAAAFGEASIAGPSTSPSPFSSSSIASGIKRGIRRHRRGATSMGSASGSGSGSASGMGSSSSSSPFSISSYDSGSAVEAEAEEGPDVDAGPASPASSILSILSSASSVLSSKAPALLATAYPREVDLSHPCTYCYLTLQSEPKESAYRGGVDAEKNGRPGARKAFKKAARLVKDKFKSHQQQQMSNDEANLVAAYWESWRQAHGKEFGDWWAEQEPESPPAETPPSQGWNLWNMTYGL